MRLFESYFTHLKKTGKIPPAGIYDGGNYSLLGRNQVFINYKIIITDESVKNFLRKYHFETITVDMQDFKPFKRDHDLKKILS